MKNAADAEEASAAVARLRAELEALPRLEAPSEVWSRLEAALASRRSRRRYELTSGVAIAAGVLVIVSLAVLRPAPMRDTDPLPSLIAESQRLERNVALDRAWVSSDATASVARRALVYGVHEVDHELARLQTESSPDRARAEALWRQRIELMRSLDEVQRQEELQAYRRVVF